MTPHRHNQSAGRVPKVIGAACRWCEGMWGTKSRFPRRVAPSSTAQALHAWMGKEQTGFFCGLRMGT